MGVGLSNRARELERRLNDERLASAGTARELESIRARGSAPESSPPLPAIALVLLPQTRSVGPIATISVPDGASLVALELRLESNGFARYQAVLKDTGTIALSGAATGSWLGAATPCRQSLSAFPPAC